jgi:hypothetical protein
MVNSDVFHVMFCHENTKEARESRIQIEDSTATAVRQMLIYLYTGELPTEYSIVKDAVPLLYIANKYQIKSLVQLIEKQLVNRFELVAQHFVSETLLCGISRGSHLFFSRLGYFNFRTD